MQDGVHVAGGEHHSGGRNSWRSDLRQSVALNSFNCRVWFMYNRTEWRTPVDTKRRTQRDLLQEQESLFQTVTSTFKTSLEWLTNVSNDQTRTHKSGAARVENHVRTRPMHVEHHVKSVVPIKTSIMNKAANGPSCQSADIECGMEIHRPCMCMKCIKNGPKATWIVQVPSFG